MKQKIVRSLFTIFSVLIMVAMTAGMTASAAATTKSLSTNFTLVNLGTTTASVTVDYVKPDGSPWTGSAYTSANIPGNGGQWIVRQYSDTNLTAGKGSVVISSSQPLGAMVQILNRSGVPTSGAYSGFTGGSQKVYIPQAARNATSSTGKANAQIMIQNTGTASATVAAKFYNWSNPSVVAATRSFSNIAAGATYYYDLSDDANLGNGWYSVALDAGTGGSIAVVVNLFFGADGLMTYNGFPSDKVDSEWFIPLLYSRLTNTLTTSVIIQNLDTVAIPANDITLNCKKDPNATGVSTLSVKIATQTPVNASAAYNTLTNTSAFPSNWYGGCRVTSASGKKMVVLIQYRYTNSPDQGAYEGIPASSTDKTLYVPLVAKILSNKFATTATIQNLSKTNTAHLTIVYTSSNGMGNFTRTGITVAPGASYIRNFRLASTESPQMANGWTGTMKVTSDTPIHAYLANTYLTVNGDQFQAYLGFTLP